MNGYDPRYMLLQAEKLKVAMTKEQSIVAVAKDWKVFSLEILWRLLVYLMLLDPPIKSGETGMTK